MTSQMLDKEKNTKKTLENRLIMMGEKTKELVTQKENYGTRLKELVAEVSDTTKNIEKITADVKNIEESIKTQDKEVKTICSTLVEKNRQIEDLSKNEKNLNETIQKLTDNVNTNKLKSLDLNEKKANLNMTAEQLKEKKNKLLAEKNEIEEELTKAHDEIKKTKNEIELLEKDIASTEDKIKEKKNKLQEANSFLKQLNDKKALVEVKAINKQNSIKKIDVEIKSVNEIRANLIKRDNALNENIKQLRNEKTSGKDVVSDYQKAIMLIQGKEAQLNVDLEKIKNQVEKNVVDVVVTISKNEACARAKMSYENGIEKLKNDTSFIQSEIGRLKTYKNGCKQLIEDSHEKLKELDKSIDNSNEKFNKAAKTYRDTKPKIAEVPINENKNNHNHDIDNYRELSS